MDLDTSAKKFKYSVINKILCVVLCLITFCSSMCVAARAVSCLLYLDDLIYNEQEDQDDWTNSTEFYRLLWTNTDHLASWVTSEKRVDQYKHYLVKNKDRYVDEAYKMVLGLRSEAEYAADVYQEYDEDDTDVTINTTYFYNEYNVYYSVKIDDINVDEMFLDASMTRENVADAFDDVIENLGDLFSYDGYHIASDAYYYAKLGDSVISNTDDLDEAKVYDSPYYIVSKHGKVESKGINQTVVEDVIGSLNGSQAYFKDVDFYFAFTPVQLGYVDSLVDLIRSSNMDYSQLYTFHLYAQKGVENVIARIVIAVALLVISFAFGFQYFLITGKRNKDDPANLIFYDYIPLEISIAVAGALGVGAFALAFVAADTIAALSVVTVLAALLFALSCWILLFFLCASLSRYINSGRKFYRHLLIYWLLFGLYKLAVLGYRLFVKIFRKFRASAQRTTNALVYKPHHFKRNVILISIAWLIVNAILAALCAISFYVESIILIVFFIILLVVLDFFVIRKVAEYVGNLDKIIDSASRHEEIALDLEKLDLSLRILAESMRYTNVELQNAIAQAVKDERLRTELITNVSHDLKTPLTSIITYVDLLSKCDINDTKAQEYIRVLDEKGNKLKRLIDDLIEASKVTSGNVTVNLAPMNLSELCLQSTVDAQSDFEKAGLDLVVKQGNKPTIVVADGTKANRVIENLLSNARKYSARASRVYVSVYNDGDYGVFEIKNISAQPLDITPDELTERFVRGDKSRNQEGNGLGLSIAKELCSLQNGKLELIIDGDLFKAKVMLPIK